MKTIAMVVGARPNFMKMAPIYHILRATYKYYIIIIHTGQHYDYEMSDIFLQQLNIPSNIIINLGCTGTQNSQIATIMLRLEEEFMYQRPDLVLVFGDVTSTLAGALTSNKMGIKVGHIEAGNRSYDRTMPEEINRKLVDSIADYLFISEPNGVNNLIREGIMDGFYVGNPMIDSLLNIKETALMNNTYKQLGLTIGQYIVVTVHRPINVDNDIRLRKIMDDLLMLSTIYKVIFPIHPRTKHNLKDIPTGDIMIIKPLGYIEFINLVMHSGLVITDAGGLSEETTILGIPCLTLRDTTERPITITHGTNILIKEIDINIVKENIGRYKHNISIPGWDGKAAERIAEIITHVYE